jgi:pimeloyl-ACP methyl ester carboxylesterase
LSLCLVWLAWSLIAYRDIPVEVLEQRYGGSGLERVEIDGTVLRYRVQGEGPALLLIHSHYFNMRIWDGWVDTLAPHFRVIRFDMTSHGLTGPDARGDYSMARDLQLIEGLLEHLAVERFSVAGSSLGGNMAFHLAARAPERVEKLVLVNSGGLPREGGRGNRGSIPFWVDYVSYLVPTGAFRRFLEWMIVDDSLVSDALVEEFHQMFRRSGNRFAEFSRLRSFDVGDPVPLLAAVRSPTLVMWGRDNPQLPLEQARKFAELMPNARVEQLVYDGVGHVIPLEIAGPGSRDLRDFLLSGSKP